MKKIFNALFVLVILFFPGEYLLAQNKMHLAGTITGTSETNMIFNPKGVGDVNGDGYADYIVPFYLGDTLMAGFHYQIYSTKLYYGSSTFDTIPDLTIDNSICYPLGDINNDGYDDIMALELNYEAVIPYTICCIYPGGTEINETQKFICEPPFYFDMEFSYKIEEIGDLNGDGYKDFIIASPYNWSDGLGRVFIYHGGETIKEEPDQILQVKLKQMGTSYFGSSVIGIGDNNKDGYDDILIAETTLSGDSGNVQLYYGGEKLDSIPDKVFLQDEIYFGKTINNLGDINHDEVNEFMITAYKGSYLYFSGDSVKYFRNKNKKVNGVNTVGSGGDINGDGIADFLIGSDLDIENNLPIVLGYYGKPIIDTLNDFEIFGEQEYSCFGYNALTNSIDIAGDINGDGYDDVVILAHSYRVSGVIVGKVYLYSYQAPSDVAKEDDSKMDFYLGQNYPNPFNPTTKIKFTIPVETLRATSLHTTLKVYDVLGREIATLVNEEKPAGNYEVEFTANNISSGMYFYELRAGNYVQTKKMVLMK